MNRLIGAAFLAAGIIMIVYGIHASDSVGSDFSRFFNGTPTNQTIWLLTGGIASVIIGSLLTLRGVNSLKK